MGLGYLTPLKNSGANSWYPTDVAGLQLLFDYKDEAGMLAPSNFIKDGSDNISQWDDLSGRSKNATQATGLLQPKYTATGVNFAGANYLNMFSESLIASNTDWTVFWVTQATSITSLSGQWNLLNSFDGAPFLFGLSNTVGYADGYFGNGTYSSPVKVNFTLATQTLIHYYELRHSAAGDIYSFTIDGNSPATSTGSNRNAATGPYLGWDENAPFAGDMRCFGLYNSALSGADQTNLQAYLLARSL